MATSPPTVTGYSPFWSNVGANFNGAAIGYNNQPRYGRSSTDYNVARWLGKPGFRGLRRTLRVLTGAAAGSSAAETYTRIQGGTLADGGVATGLVPIETVTVQTGNTTAADITYINANMTDRVFLMHPTIANYPVDASGNGGGGKVQT